MDENTRNEIKKMIQEALDAREGQNQFQVQPTPFHEHNGVDSPLITAPGMTLGPFKFSSDANLNLAMPKLSGADNSNVGFIITGADGQPVLKMNDNAFITAFNKAFAAASNASGPFGNDWYQFYCQLDSIPSPTGPTAGVIEAPNSNRILIKKSGGGMMMRFQGGSPSVAATAGVIDINYPLALGVYSTGPSRPANMNNGSSTTAIAGTFYYNSSSKTLQYHNGANWIALATAGTI